MDKPRPAAERVRPMLQAMERSIDSARRQRLKTDEPPAPSVLPATTTPEREPTNGTGGDTIARLRARPKRATPFPPADRNPSIPSRTG